MSWIATIALDEADVGERRRGDGVADRPHAGLAGAAELVDLDEAAVVDLHAGAVEAEVVGVGRRPTDTTTTSTSRASPPDLHGGAGAASGEWPVDLDAGADVDAAALEALLDDLGDVLVEAREDLRQRLEDRDLGAEVGQHRGELAADDAAADDRRRSSAARRSTRNSSDVITILPSTSKPGSVRGTEPGGQDDGVAGELDVARAAAGHGDALAGVQPAVAVEHGDLAALEQRAEARR